MVKHGNAESMKEKHSNCMGSFTAFCSGKVVILIRARSYSPPKPAREFFVAICGGKSLTLK